MDRVEKLSRDRAIIISGLILISGLAWLYIVRLASLMASGMDMPAMSGDRGHAMSMVLPQVRPWGAADFGLTFVMWTVMMVAMMTPSTAPMTITFASLVRNRAARSGPITATTAFLLGYAVVWTGFSAGATVLQWLLHTAGSLSPATMRAAPVAGGTLLVLAGIYQVTPWKDACLTSCRSPLGFLMAGWRDGTGGAFVMGARHGLYCLGCCWSLMLVLFAVGVMNLLWVALIAGYVLVEKLIPAGPWLGRSLGVVLIASGIWMIVSGA